MKAKCISHFWQVALAVLIISCKQPAEYSVKKVLRLDNQWSFQMRGDTAWYPARVPGCVHTDLLENGIIKDPFYRTNEKDLQWIDQKDWVYRCNFNLDSSKMLFDKAELIFNGLDTYTEIYLNGNLLIETDNMFREWSAEVKPLLHPGNNILEIVFFSPIIKGLEKLYEHGYGLPAANDQSEIGEIGDKKVSVFTRKAPYHFGWDWGPRFVTSGVWRPVELTFYNAAIIKDVYYRQSLINESEAKIDAVIEISAVHEGNFGVKIFNDKQKEPIAETTVELEEGINSITLPFQIKKPYLWWPNGMGKPYLYHFRAEIFKRDKIIDTLSTSIGLRSIDLITESDSKGKSFYFEINGVPVFAKGANYIPNDNFLNRVDSSKYEDIISAAVRANMNMLRVWGGGIYENDLFYELCDKYGILVWQDFMFSCSMYPGDAAFLQNVENEITDNIRRLRNHASIALWCGNNEIDVAWCEGDDKCGWGWKQKYNKSQREEIWQSYDTLFHKILPDLIETHDQTRAYWPSSPTADWGKHSTYSSTSGDMHYWGVWHGNEPFNSFYSVTTRFMSEYGFQSFPEFNSIKKFTIPGDWNTESEVMRSHQRSGYGNSRIMDYMKRLYPVPTSFEQILYVSQVMQAEAIKNAILAHRSMKPYCMGSLYWQLNDCWPVASWSSIDYYGNWKALQYFVKKAFAPVSISFVPDSGDVEVFVNSDLSRIRIVDVVYKFVDFNGKVLFQQSAKSKITPERSNRIVTLNPRDLDPKADLTNLLLDVSVIENGKLIASDHYFFADPKDLKLESALITKSIKKEGKRVIIKLASQKLIKNAFISIDGINAILSDNYFDILPGEKVTVTFENNGNQDITEDNIRIISLNSIE